MRKSILLLLSFLFIILSAQAQITKGSILLGGGFGFSTINSTSPNTSPQLTQFDFSPSIGVAVKDNNVYGLFFIYSHSNDRDRVQINNAYVGGVYWRKYLPVGKNFYFFTAAELSYYYSQNNYTVPSQVQISKEYNVFINIYPGITYSLSKHFHLEATLTNLVSLGYTHLKSTTTDNSGTYATKQDGVYLNTHVSAGNPFNFGFRFILPK